MYTVKSDPHSSGEVWRALRAAAPQTVPVFAGYLVLGMGYGIYVQSLGLPVWMPMLMGTVVYGGSLEFVLASLLLGAFAPLSAFLMALMIQARHLFYGLAMLERYKGYGLRSVYMIYAMSDETFSCRRCSMPDNFSSVAFSSAFRRSIVPVKDARSLAISLSMAARSISRCASNPRSLAS